MLVVKKAEDGDFKEAMQQAKRFLDILVCDEHLYGSVEDVLENLLHASHWAPKFLAALLSLYAQKYEDALALIGEVLEGHQCAEALYIKSRALAKLERYTEADETNCQLANVFEMATPDAKVLFMIAMLFQYALQPYHVFLCRSPGRFAICDFKLFVYFLSLFLIVELLDSAIEHFDVLN